MSMSDERRKQLFSLLDALGAKDRAYLVLEYGWQERSMIDELKADLLDEASAHSVRTPEEFADLICTLRDQKRNWSRRLGKLLITVDQLITRNEKQAAIKEIDDFISICTAPFYREIAVNEKSKLK